MMSLAEALRLLAEPSPDPAPPSEVFLACGCMPLHLRTFLAAHLRAHDPTGRSTIVSAGAYGDGLGNVELLPSSGCEAGAVALEWSDLDPRLGLRRLGGWGPGDLDDILRTVESGLARAEAAIRWASEAMPLALSMPTLPLPPLSITATRQAGAFDLRLCEMASGFAARVACASGVRIVNPQRLDRDSPPGERLDARMELAAGFPYRTRHASALAALLAGLLRPPSPKKGLITDLDGTLWRGILGEVGPAEITWNLDRNAHGHALYQRMLRALSDAGVLIGVASKNSPEVVAEALRRSDLLLSPDRVFPIEAHWGPKSESVGRILRAWNVGADAVVFIDDSPMELAEVRAGHPDVEGILFPGGDDQAVFDLLGRLRDLFGKESLTAEDALRVDSLRGGEALRSALDDGGAAPDDFLRGLQAELTLSFAKEPHDPRALELINKTNQFNLNGRRLAEADWRSFLADPGTFLLRASYRDKFGPLGTIAVAAGRRPEGALPTVEAWVMSCRAFSRRIEHCCLLALFESTGSESLTLDFSPTPKNRPLCEFLTSILGKAPEGPAVRVARADFEARRPELYPRIQVEDHD